MSFSPKRLAFITPRYSPKSAGGAEVHCQLLAEQVAGLGHQVDVLTTCAKDHFTWDNYFAPGRESINGVTVRRFQVNPDRNLERFHSIQSRISNRQKVTPEEEVQWIEGSVVSRELESYLKQNHERYDFIVFIPYLFGTTYWGAKLFPEKTLLIPCLHDEPFAYLSIFKEMFSSVRGLMFNTYPEMKFAQNLYSLEPEKCSLVSLAFERGKTVGQELFRKKFGVRDPYILFAGRREKGKNVPLLIENFRAYKRHNENNLKLVLLGSGAVELFPEDEGNILDFGYVSEDEKLSATEGALAFCQPSVNESLSIVVLQSWLYKVPALVHGKCAVTRDHCEKSNGGLYFGNYYEFEECLNFFLSQPETAKKMGANGCRYVETFFNWKAVLERFQQALEQFSPAKAAL